MRNYKVALALISSAFGFGNAVTGYASAAYSIIDLGDLGGNYSRASAINSSGQVVGYSLLPVAGIVENAFNWQSSQMQNLGTLGGLRSRALDINDSGEIAGYAQNSNGNYLPAVWAGNSITALPTLGGAAGSAVAINNAGIAAGASITAAGASHAVIWSGGTANDLGTLGGTYSFAYDINQSGIVAGTAFDSANKEKACLWNSGRTIDLSSVSGGYFTAARGVNDSGQVILWGMPIGATSNHATFWDGDPQNSAIDLGTLGGSESWAYALNNNGYVVGSASTPRDSETHAFVWDGSEKTDLGTLPGGYFSSAFGINDQGIIVGFSLDASGNTHAVEWVPISVPEPSFLVQGMLWSGATALWFFWRRRQVSSNDIIC